MFQVLTLEDVFYVRDNQLVEAEEHDGLKRSNLMLFNTHLNVDYPVYKMTHRSFTNKK